MTAIKHPPPVSKDWAFLEWTDIPSKVNTGQVYLRRLRLFNTPWLSLFVHWIFEEDTDRDPHDHPWSFASFIFSGGYLEKVWPDPQMPAVYAYHYRLGRGLHRTSTAIAHQIVSLRPGTITIVATGPRRRGWGFWVPNEGGTADFVLWKQYLDEVDVPA
jgi:hypothetical protein